MAMASSPERDLARFADYYGFRMDLLSGADRYAIENAPDGFSGAVSAVRITENGRFGNIFYQILHAVILARQLCAETVLAFPFTGCPPVPEVAVEELRVVFRPDSLPAMARVPTLVGHFFNSYAFESALQALPPAFVHDTIERYMKPLFGWVPGRVQPVGSGTLVMNFRAGDVFRGEPGTAWYVQPPASFYLRAIAFARAELQVQDVRLVFEDRGNPAIGVVEAALTAQQIPFVSQSASLAEDFDCLAGASHLVVPYSTFGEVAALLSEHIETYFGFRSFESHQHIHRRVEPLMLGVLHQKGVRAVLIDDPDGDYILPRSWNRSPAQLRLITDYPQDKLRITEGRDADRIEAAEAIATLRSQMLESQQEASRLRHRLIASRQQGDAVVDRLAAAEQQLASADARMHESQERFERVIYQSTSWRVTAPLRWAARLLGRMRGRAEEDA